MRNLNLALALLLTAGCSHSVPIASLSSSPTAPSSVSGVGAPIALAEKVILVIGDDQKPVAGAEILIGSMSGVPFRGNLIKTGTDGKVSLPEAWQSTAAVTIEAKGYVRSTFLSLTPAGLSFTIRRAPMGSLTLKGKATGFGNLKSNGTLDVGLVFQSVNRSDLSALDLTRLISPDVDHQKAYGFDIAIPANLSIPSQSESIFLFVPVSLDKPDFRTAILAGMQPTSTIAAVGAQFDFKKMIGDLKDGKSFFDLINGLRFRSYSVRAVQTPAALAGVTQALDIPTNEIPIASGPALQVGALPAGYAVVATALTDHAGAFVVTDVKRLLSGEKRNLGVAYQGQSSWIVRTLKKYEPERTNFAGSDYEELSSIVLPANQTPAADFLPIVKPLTVSGRTLFFSSPALPAGLDRGGTRVTLSKVQFLNKGTLNLVDKTPLWDFWSPDYIGQIELPTLSSDPWTQKGQYRWELSFGAKPLGSNEHTHLTRASVDFIF